MMKLFTLLAAFLAAVQVASAQRMLQKPHEFHQKKTRQLMTTKPDPPAPKGKGKGMMGKGMGMMRSKVKAVKTPKAPKVPKAKGGGEMESAKGKGMESAKGKGMESAKGKGKGAESSKGKGKGKGVDGLQTLAEIVTSTPDLVYLAKAMEEAEILEFFESTEFEYTVFAPDNAAFNVLFTAAPELGKVLFDDEWILHLLDLLTMHVTEPTVLSTDLSDGQVVDTFNEGETLTVSTTDGVCFTPSVSGSSCVSTADVLAKNGVAHIVDDVLEPFWIDLSVMDVVSAIPELSTLVSLLECSGLDDALASVFGVTIFGPTNDAFVDADAAFLCSEEGLPTLVDILTYHVLPSVLPSVLIPEGTKDFPTLQGKYVTTTYKDSEDPALVVAMVNDANIIAVDFGANNGIVHVIDKILVPPPGDAKGKGKGKGKGSAKSAKVSGKGKGKGKGSKSGERR